MKMYAQLFTEVLSFKTHNKRLQLKSFVIWVRNYLFLKDYVTSEGAVSHNVLYINIAHYLFSMTLLTAFINFFSFIFSSFFFFFLSSFLACFSSAVNPSSSLTLDKSLLCTLLTSLGVLMRSISRSISRLILGERVLNEIILADFIFRRNLCRLETNYVKITKIIMLRFIML